MQSYNKMVNIQQLKIIIFTFMTNTTKHHTDSTLCEVQIRYI